MQGEAAGLFQPPYYNVPYQQTWDPYSSMASYPSGGNGIFDEPTVCSPTDHFSSEIIDDMITENMYFGSDMPRNHNVPLNKVPEGDPSLFDSINSPNLYVQQYPPTQQSNFPNYSNIPIERVPSSEGCCRESDFQCTSDTESGFYSSDSVVSPFSEFKSFDPKLNNLNSQDDPSLFGLTSKMHELLLPNTQESSFLNMEAPYHVSSRGSISVISSNRLYSNSVDEYASNTMETVKLECTQNRVETWPIANEHDVASSNNFQTKMTATTTCAPVRTNQNKTIKKRNRSRRRRKADKEKCVHLWEFIRDILLEPKHCPSLMKWEDRQAGVFRFVKSDTVASMWGRKKQNPKMTYEKLSRAMRYYYNRGILERVDGRRLVYKFGPNAFGWKSEKEEKSQGNQSPSPICKNQLPPHSISCDVTTAAYPMCENLKSQIDSNQCRLLPSANVLLGGPAPYFGA